MGAGEDEPWKQTKTHTVVPGQPTRSQVVIAGALGLLGLALLCGAAFLSTPVAVRVLFGIGGLALIFFGASRAMGDRKTGVEATRDGFKVASESPIGYTETETIERTGFDPEGKSPIPEEGPGSPAPKSPAGPA